MANWIVNWGINRLKEPSTWRGLIALATAFGMVIRPEVADAIIALGLALMGGVNVVTTEPGMATRLATPPHQLHDDPVPTPDSRPSIQPGPKRGAFDDLDRFGSG